MSDTVPTWQAPSAELYGDVRLAEGVSIWPNAVIRAELAHVEVGAYSNIQDFAMLHIGAGATVIGEYCSITHHVTVHGATIGDNCLIGINATIMDDAVIGPNSIVAGHTIVTQGSVFPANSVIAGVPGKLIRQHDNRVENKLNALAYHENALAYARGYYRRWSDSDYAQRMDEWRDMLSREPS